jgi:hypothetical protein
MKVHNEKKVCRFFYNGGLGYAGSCITLSGSSHNKKFFVWFCTQFFFVMAAVRHSADRFFWYAPANVFLKQIPFLQF